MVRLGPRWRNPAKPRSWPTPGLRISWWFTRCGEKQSGAASLRSPEKCVCPLQWIRWKSPPGYFVPLIRPMLKSASGWSLTPGSGAAGSRANRESMEVARKIIGLPNLRWEGISVYPGHIMGNRSIREKDLVRENEQLDRIFSELNAAGVPYPVVSGGNTPAAFENHRFHGVNEIRPGTYVFNDRNTVEAESAGYSDCAPAVLATVVSTSVTGKAMVDAGSKTLSSDGLLSGSRNYFGVVVGHPDLTLEELSEEHGHLGLAPELLAQGR